MKTVREKDMEGLELLCIVNALAAAVLGILFLFNVLQNYWFLNFVLGLGTLLHIVLVLLFWLKHQRVFTAVSAVFAVFYAACLVYFNFL